MVELLKMGYAQTYLNIRQKARMERMSEIKLKPCPFCGGEASIKSVTKGIFVKKVGYFAVCNSCGASTHVALNINDVPHKWNRRADNER